MDLIQLDRSLRPAGAAEVMDRLAAIAGFDRTEHALVSRAYLSTPTLVGRDTSLERFRRRFAKAWTGKGNAVLVHGPRGVGRSRFLDACVLEAKVAGAIAVSVEGTGKAADDWGVARELATQLFDAAPDLARVAAGRNRGLLSQLVPGLRRDDRTGSAAPEPHPVATQAELQPALREWLLAVAKERPVVVSVDDLHHADLPSLSLVALLARESSSHPLLVLASLPSEQRGRASKALELFEANSRAMRLGPLGPKRTEKLIHALFGDVPNVQSVASRFHGVSGGLPRDLMQLAQHLVDQGVARYGSGAWVLPSRFAGNELPASMAQARQAKIDALSPEARLMAQAIALGPDGLYSFDECVTMSNDGDAARVMRTLDELIQSGLVLLAANDYGLEGDGWRETLRQSVEPESARELYLGLARVFQRRPGGDFRTAEYLLAAGEDEAGLDALLCFSEASIANTATNMDAFTELVQSLPEHWLDVCDRGLEICEAHDRPAKDRVLLWTRVTGLASQVPVDALSYFAPLLAQLRHDSGLDLYDASDPGLPAAARLQSALSRAKARHESGAGGSVYDPKTAIGQLGRAVAAAAGNVSSTLALDLFQILPSLEPFAPLAPALSAWQALIEGLGARITAQSERARTIYENQLVRLAAPDRAGLDETYQKTQELGIALVLGTLEASMGLAVSLERAKKLESSPLHEVNAMRIRMLYHLWQGDVAAADECKQAAEVLIVERAKRQTNEGAHLPRELSAHALAGDLTRVKRTLAAIEPLARRAAGWHPVLHWARAEYERIRGNGAKALGEIETALSSMDPAGHPAWPDVAAAHVKILLALGRPRDAKQRGEAYLAEAARRGVGYEQSYIRMPFAVALARLELGEEAVCQAQRVIDCFGALGSTGMNVGLACETRARVALELGDMQTFSHFADLTADQFRAGSSPALAARYEHLMRDADRRGGAATGEGSHETGMAERSIIQVLETCSTEEERFSATLHLLLEQAGAAEGVLLRPEGGQLVVKASTEPGAVPEEVLADARRFWEEQQEGSVTALVDETGPDGSDSETAVRHAYRPVLLSHRVAGSLALTGVVMVVPEPGKPFRPPVSLAVEASRLVLGDESAILVAS